MPGPGRPPNPPPPEFYVECQKCGAKIYFAAAGAQVKPTDEHTCPSCGFQFRILRRRPPTRKKAG